MGTAEKTLETMAEKIAGTYKVGDCEIELPRVEDEGLDQDEEWLWLDTGDGREKVRATVWLVRCWRVWARKRSWALTSLKRRQKRLTVTARESTMTTTWWTSRTSLKMSGKGWRPRTSTALQLWRRWGLEICRPRPSQRRTI